MEERRAGRARGEKKGRGRNLERTRQLTWRKNRENKERDILIEGVVMWLKRNLTLEKFSGIHKDDPS